MDLRPERLDLRPERLDLRPERLDLRPERSDLRPKRSDLRPKRSDLRPEGPNEGEGDGQTNERTKVPCVLQDFVPFGAAAQKVKCDRPTNRLTDKAGCRVACTRLKTHAVIFLDEK